VPTVATIAHVVAARPARGRWCVRRPQRAAGAVHTTVAVVAYPRISNLDEFQPLKNVPGVRLQWVRSPADVAGLRPNDWMVLPGSKATAADLAWLRAQGLDQCHRRARGAGGGAVLGMCGGLQMLGEALIDPEGIDGNGPGLGLLPLVTVFEPAKTVRRCWACSPGVRCAPPSGRPRFFRSTPSPCVMQCSQGPVPVMRSVSLKAVRMTSVWGIPVCRTI
jgi:cobyric acid synthase